MCRHIGGAEVVHRRLRLRLAIGAGEPLDRDGQAAQTRVGVQRNRARARQRRAHWASHPRRVVPHVGGGSVMEGGGARLSKRGGQIRVIEHGRQRALQEPAPTRSPRARISHLSEVWIFTPWRSSHGQPGGRGWCRGEEVVVTEMSFPWLPATRPRIRRLRAKAATTPGRLRIAMGAVVLAVLLAGLAIGALTTVRRDAANAVATRDEPLMVQADRLYASLSDADATAATTFLRGGVEPSNLRGRYLADLRNASLQLAGLGRRVHGSVEAAAICCDRGRAARLQRPHGDCPRQQQAGIPGRRRLRAPSVRPHAREDAAGRRTAVRRPRRSASPSISAPARRHGQP